MTYTDILYEDLEKFPLKLENGILVLGNFDGVHRGHQTLINNAKHMSMLLGKPLVIFTFVRHPKLCFDDTMEPFLITSLETKSLYLSELGVDGILGIDFNVVKDLTAQEFINETIIKKLKADIVIVGDDFKFGKNRSGDTNLLKSCSEFETFVVQEKSDSEGISFSSTNIRQFIKNGAVQKASGQLGRPFEIYSTVIQGQRLGNKIGFPTANIKFEQDTIRPKYGVYAVNVNIIEQKKWFNGIANFGIRPTVDDNTETLEVHLFNFDQDIYGKEIRVSFIEYIREEQKFNNIDELKQQIGNDCEIAKQIHKLRIAGG